MLEAALRDSPRLAEANARWLAAQAQAAAAAAGQQPAARFKGSEERLKVPSGFGPYLLGGHTVWYGSLGAALSWDPDLWGQHADQGAAARHLSDAADMDRADARLLLSGAVVQAYLQLDRADALEDIAADTAGTARAHRGDHAPARGGWTGHACGAAGGRGCGAADAPGAAAGAGAGGAGAP